MTSAIWPLMLSGIALLCLWVIGLVTLSRNRDRDERRELARALRERDDLK